MCFCLIWLFSLDEPSGKCCLSHRVSCRRNDPTMQCNDTKLLRCDWNKVGAGLWFQFCCTSLGKVAWLFPITTSSSSSVSNHYEPIRNNYRPATSPWALSTASNLINLYRQCSRMIYRCSLACMTVMMWDSLSGYNSLGGMAVVRCCPASAGEDEQTRVWHQGQLVMEWYQCEHDHEWTCLHLYGSLKSYNHVSSWS